MIDLASLGAIVSALVVLVVVVLMVLGVLDVRPRPRVSEFDLYRRHRDKKAAATRVLAPHGAAPLPSWVTDPLVVHEPDTHQGLYAARERLRESDPALAMHLDTILPVSKPEPPKPPAGGFSKPPHPPEGPGGASGPGWAEKIADAESKVIEAAKPPKRQWCRIVHPVDGGSVTIDVAAQSLIHWLTEQWRDPTCTDRETARREDNLRQALELHAYDEETVEVYSGDGHVETIGTGVAVRRHAEVSLTAKDVRSYTEAVRLHAQASDFLLDMERQRARGQWTASDELKRQELIATRERLARSIDAQTQWWPGGMI